MYQQIGANQTNMMNMQNAIADRQAAQAAAQEEAGVKALIPAYTYALQNPTDLDGAFNLVPPEMRDAVAPSLQALRGKSPEAVKSALIGSLSSSDYGKAVLDNLARAETAAIQRGNLDLSRQRLAAEAATVGQPKPMTEYEAARLKLDQEKAAREAKTAPAGGAATESERTAAYNAGRALQAAQRISDAVATEPSANAPGAGEALTSYFMDPNVVRSGARQRVSAAQRDMIDALLTLATGAAYNKEQLEGQMQSYIPRWSDDPETRADKQQALLNLIQNAKLKAGRAWTPEMDAQFQSLLTANEPSAAENAPNDGAIDFNSLGD